MTEKHIVDVLNSVKEISARKVDCETFIQVWCGGTTVNVYRAKSRDILEEITCWTMSDDEGRAPEHYDIRVHMKLWFDRAEEEGW